MNSLAKLFEPSKDRLIGNAKRMMDTATDPWFQQCIQKTSLNILGNAISQMTWDNKGPLKAIRTGPPYARSLLTLTKTFII